MYEVVKKSCSQSHGLFPGTAKEREREKKGKRGRINEERDENNKRTEGGGEKNRGEDGRISSVERRRDGEKDEVEGVGNGLKTGLSGRGRKERCTAGCRASNSRHKHGMGITWNG